MEPGDARLAHRASCHEQDPARGRSRRHPDARVSRRGAAVDRVGVALRPPDARARPAERHRASGQRRGRGVGRWRSAPPRAPTVEVNDLFYNLPARRKFLKSDGAESAQVSRIVTQLALAYPEAGFTLTSGRPDAAAVPAGGLAARSPVSDLRRARRSDRGGEERGRPSGDRLHRGAGRNREPTRGVQHVFINRRIVKDRTIAHAILDAYSVASIKERSPEVHLFLEMPPESVDVNVHPTKAEVRFREQSLVHEVVRRALMDALGQTERAAAAVAARDGVFTIRSRPRSRASSPAACIRIGGCPGRDPMRRTCVQCDAGSGFSRNVEPSAEQSA